MKFRNIFFAILFANPVLASEEMREGEILDEDSIVFSIEEANEMQKYISEIEHDLSNKEKMIEGYQVLDSVQKDQIETFQDWLNNKDKEIDKYLEIQKLDQKEIERLTKQARLKKIENVLIFSGGVATTIALILIADKVNDGIEQNNGGI